MNKRDDIWFIYDGECPLCRMGASLYKVRQSVGILYIVDARKEKQHPVMQEINKSKLNLDEGMVVKYKGKLYHGHEALGIMAELGADVGVFNKIHKRLFHSRFLAALLYPFMRAARNMALLLKGVGRINNLHS